MTNSQKARTKLFQSLEFQEKAAATLGLPEMLVAGCKLLDLKFPNKDELPDCCRALIATTRSGFLVAMQELDENLGRSVTNSWSVLADTFLAMHMPWVAFHRVRWYEVYPYYFSKNEENVSRVFPKADDRRFEYEQDPVVRRRIWVALGLSGVSGNSH